MKDTLAEYTTVHAAMAGARLPITLAELHGSMCGLLCAGGAAAVPPWVEECLGSGDSVEGAVEAARDRLRELELHSWRSLNGLGLEFYPLLPDDGAALDERVGALAQWCHGFLLGLGLAGFPMDGREADEPDRAPLREIVHDFSEISRAGLGAGEFEHEEQADFALAELVEYVRVSVQIVFEELESARIGDADPRTVH